MEYNREYWEPRIAAKPNRFRKLNESNDYVELINEPEAITQEGTAFTAARLNNIEAGIEGVSAILESTRSKSGGGIMYNQRATVNLPYDVWDIDIYDDIVFAVVPYGDIYKSTDGGATFSALGVTPKFWLGVAQTRSDAYFITSNNELYYLADKNGSILIKKSHTMPVVSGICAEGESLFFACPYNGLYYTESSSFVPRKIFSSSLNINDVCICNGKIYFSCFNEGIYRIDGNTATRIAQNRPYRKISGSGDVVSYVEQNGSHYYQDVSKPQIVERFLAGVFQYNAIAHHKDKMITAHTGASSSTNLIPFSFTSYGLIKTAGEINIPGYSTGLYGKPDQGSRRRIYAEAETTITAIGGTTIEGKATMKLSAGHKVELELIGTDWRKVVLSQSDTPEAGKAMVWPDSGLNADTATLATQALAIKPLGNSITLPAVSTSVTKIIKLGTVDWTYTGSINIGCSGANIEDAIKVHISGGNSAPSGLRVLYGKNNGNFGVKKIIVTRATEIWNSNRHIYIEIVSASNGGSTTTFGVVETNKGIFTPSMTEVSSVDGILVDSLSLDYLRGDISSYQHVFTKSIVGDITGAASKIPFTTKTGTSTGTQGQASFDDSYLYLCTATNVWKRVALTSF